MADRDAWQRYLVDLDIALAQAEELAAHVQDAAASGDYAQAGRASESILSGAHTRPTSPRPPAGEAIPDALVDYARDIAQRQQRAVRTLSEQQHKIAGELDTMSRRQATPSSGPVYLDTQG